MTVSVSLHLQNNNKTNVYFPNLIVNLWCSFYFTAEDWLFLPEKEVILTTISFLSLQNLNGIKSLSLTEQFIYTMIAFLGKENIFLESDVRVLLANFVQTTFKSQKSLDFNSKFGGMSQFLDFFRSQNEINGFFLFTGKFNFENLYIAFLDQFQGASYGDNTFGRLVMAPLAQKHNIKWRQMIWSEHVHVLRFVTCTENEVSCGIVVVEFFSELINDHSIFPVDRRTN